MSKKDLFKELMKLVDTIEGDNYMRERLLDTVSDFNRGMSSKGVIVELLDIRENIEGNNYTRDRISSLIPKIIQYKTVWKLSESGYK